MFDEARLRLTLWFAGAFAAIIVVIGLAVMFSARTALYAQIDDDLETRANPLVRSLAGRPFDPQLEVIRQFATSPGYFYALIGPNGSVISARSFNVDDVTLPEASDLRSATESDGVGYLDADTTEGDSVRIYAIQLSDGSGRTYFFQLGRSIEPEQDALRRLVFILIAGGAAGLVLSIGGGYWIAGRALRPIRVSVKAQREFVADASHELRTPLAIIRANAEILVRQAGQPVDMVSVNDIIKESERLTYLVSQMLTLARADTQDVRIATEPVDLSLVAEDIGRQMRLLAADKNISVSVDSSGSAVVDGNELRLGELLIILLDNAIKYTDDGGAVKVAVQRRDDGRVQFEVSDTGHGIPPEALSRVFERFYRADKARSRELGGTGLGLAIAKWIVDSHSGTISIKSESSGTTVTVSLPGIELADFAVEPEREAPDHPIDVPEPEA